MPMEIYMLISNMKKGQAQTMDMHSLLLSMFEALIQNKLTRDQQQDIIKMKKFMEDMVNVPRELMPQVRSKSYNMSSLKYVQEQIFSFLDWKSYLTNILPKYMKNNVTDNMTIGFYGGRLPVLKWTNDVVLNISATDCKTVHNYIWFAVLYKLLASVSYSSKMMDPKSKPKLTGRGLDSNLTAMFNPLVGAVTKSYCEKMVKNRHSYLWVAFGALFVQHVYSEQTKPKLQQVIQNIKDKMIDILQDANWLDEATKALALEKVIAMRYYAGFPDIMSAENSHMLHKYYIDVSNVTSSYGMRKALDRKNFHENIEMLLDPTAEEWLTDSVGWPYGMTLYNAFYIHNKNEFYIPAGIASPPLFWGNSTRSLNYGGMGTIIGHEITHGFDNTGRLFDKMGNFTNWWTNDSAKLFNNRSNCFVNQYSDLPTRIGNGKLNGTTVIGELIADAGGIKAAYLAYRGVIDSEGNEEPRLPGLMHLSHDQIFFIANAQPWCGMFIDDILYNLAPSTHPDTKFRIAMLMTNSEYFQKAFQCRKGAVMNPPKQCEVWL